MSTIKDHVQSIVSGVTPEDMAAVILNAIEETRRGRALVKGPKGGAGDFTAPSDTDSSWERDKHAEMDKDRWKRRYANYHNSRANNTRTLKRSSDTRSPAEIDMDLRSRKSEHELDKETATATAHSRFSNEHGGNDDIRARVIRNKLKSYNPIKKFQAAGIPAKAIVGKHWRFLKDRSGKPVSSPAEAIKHLTYEDDLLSKAQRQFLGSRDGVHNDPSKDSYFHPGGEGNRTKEIRSSLRTQYDPSVSLSHARNEAHKAYREHLNSVGVDQDYHEDPRLNDHISHAQGKSAELTPAHVTAGVSAWKKEKEEENSKHASNTLERHLPSKDEVDKRPLRGLPHGWREAHKGDAKHLGKWVTTKHACLADALDGKFGSEEHNPPYPGYSAYHELSAEGHEFGHDYKGNGHNKAGKYYGYKPKHVILGPSGQVVGLHRKVDSFADDRTPHVHPTALVAPHAGQNNDVNNAHSPDVANLFHKHAFEMGGIHNDHSPEMLAKKEQ